jgi:hypothetical protein
MADEEELWIKENDPEYQKHLDSGGCQCGHWQCLGCDQDYV